MKKSSLYLFAIAFFQFVSLIAYAQKNQPNGVEAPAQGNNLVYVTPTAVGVGTSAPLAQFHTTGSLRFSGIGNNNSLTKMMVQDALGNVFYRDASTLISQNAWLLTGNAGTNPFAQFLGTTDYQRLGLRTNNEERFTVAPTGYIGINHTAPSRLLTLNNMNPHDNAEIWMRQTAGSELGAYISLDNRANLGGQLWSIGSTGPLNSPTVAGALEFYQFGFGTRMMMDAQGRFGVGIGNGVLPTAILHTKGAVRLQDLPTGTGNVLVVDGNGNVYKSAYTARMSGSVDNVEVQQLKNEVETLKAELAKLKQLIMEKK